MSANICFNPETVVCNMVFYPASNAGGDNLVRFIDAMKSVDLGGCNSA